MIDRGDPDYDVVNETLVQVCKMASMLWKRQGHDDALWEARHEPFYGWAMRCGTCGENVVVQYLPPNTPMLCGIIVNMLHTRCGDRVYVPMQDEIVLEVWK